MFPTTIWTTIRLAGEHDRDALESVAAKYRLPVLEYIQRRGFGGAEGEDLCHEVFLRVLQGGVLAKADPQRGRFRNLLLTVTTRVVQDRLRRRTERPVEHVEPAVAPEEFDRGWALHLTERALQRMREQRSPYYDVLEGHLTGQPQDRNRLWLARRRLSAEIRREIAFTCASHEDAEQELAYLARFLRPGDSP